MKMFYFEVSANDTILGTWEAESEQQARDLCAQDAGCASEAEMVAQLEHPSEWVARKVHTSQEAPPEVPEAST
jgi:hypothetical protein